MLLRSCEAQSHAGSQCCQRSPFVVWLRAVNREHISAAAVVGFFAVFAVAVSQRYAVSDPWKPYAQAVREYMAVAVRGDSAALARRSAGTQPVAWVLDAAQQRPAMLTGWSQELQSATGHRRGDTVVVLLWADNIAGCSHLTSISASLLNHSAAPRVLALSSPCVDRRPLPALPW